MSYDPTDEAAAAARGLTAAHLRAIQEQLGVSNAQVATVSEGGLRRLLRKLDLPDRPRERAEFRRLQEVGDDHRIPPGAPARALEQLESARVRWAAPRRRVAGVPCGVTVAPRTLSPPLLPAGAGVPPAGTGWVSLGPGGVGGRTRSIIVDPTQPARSWAASVGGGVWITENDGLNWLPVDDRMANLAVSCMTMDPTDPLTLYAGTGEGFFNVDAIRGAGIFRTTDGTHWAQLPATNTASFHWVNRLAVAADGIAVLAATRTGIFRSTDADRLVWTPVLEGDVADVHFHPTDPQRAVAGGLRNGTAYFSTDGGATWSVAGHAAPWSGRVELTFAAADSMAVYASVQMSTGQIWRSADGGHSYVKRNAHNPNGFPANFLGQQGWYDNAIWAGDPTDGDLVVVGGIDLWRSTDGGQTLQPISDWREPASAHADHHAIVSHPGYDGASNRTVYFGNDGGIHRAGDVRTAGNDPQRVQGWTNLVNGYAVTQFYSGAGHPGSGTLVGGAQDNGTLSFSPGAGADRWREILGGDGGYCAADPNDPQVFYEEYVYLDLHRNTNGATSDANWWEGYISGRYFNTVVNGWDWKPLPYTIPDAMNENALFIAPFVLDPNDSNRLLAGGLSLWRTNDAKAPNTSSEGPSWESIKAPATDYVSAIAVAAGDPDVVWVGHADGQVYHCADGTSASPTWELVNSAGPSGLPAARFCTRILIDPANHLRVYVTFGGFTAGNVWRTLDGGLSWSDLSGPLPHAPVRALALHPRRPEFVYVGTEVGLFTSEEHGVTWSPTNEGPTNCSVYDLFWMGEVLVCVTHGRGMFEIDLSGV